MNLFRFPNDDYQKVILTIDKNKEDVFNEISE